MEKPISGNDAQYAQSSTFYHRGGKGGGGGGIDGSTTTSSGANTTNRTHNSSSTIYEENGINDDYSNRYPSGGLRRGPLHASTPSTPASLPLSSPYNDAIIMISNNNSNSSNYTDSSENDENDGHRSNHYRRHIRNGNDNDNNNSSSSLHNHSRTTSSFNDDDDDEGRGCAYECGYEDVLDKPPKLSDFLINDHCYQRHLLEGKRGVYRGIRGGGARMNKTGASSVASSSSSSSAAKHHGTTSSSGGIFLAKLCAGYSFVGMIFLIFISILLETQPLYISGISVKEKTSSSLKEGKDYYYPDEDEENFKFRQETSNALKAAAAYFLLMVLSLSYTQVQDMNFELMHYHTALVGRVCHVRRLVVSAYCRYRRRHYDCIPDGHHRDDADNGSHGHYDDGVLVSFLPMHHHTGENTQLLSSSVSNSRQRKNRRNSPRHQLDVDVGDSGNDVAGIGGGGTGGGSVMVVVEGFLGKLKSWGIGGGGGGSSSRRGRKKDK